MSTEDEIMYRRVRIGVEFFDRIIENNYFYVDKTLFIKDFLENQGDVTLITRPRRFGKTLNMNMLQTFFDITKDTKAMFEGLKITEYPDIIEKHQNKYPVIYISLKDIESTTYAGALTSLALEIADLFDMHDYLEKSDALNDAIKSKFKTYTTADVSEDMLKKSLKFLTKCLYTHHRNKVIILIDEYDTPLNNAVFENFYPEMIKFMRVFLGGVFKSNNNLEFGLLTGVQRIAKESLMSSFNNPKVVGIMDDDFATSFGFTEDEVKTACEEFGLNDNFDDVKNWYDGYRFGDKDMFNPWSITGYLQEKKIKNFWVNTGGTGLMDNMIALGSEGLKNDLAGLLTGTSIYMVYNSSITFPINYENDNAFWSILLNTGYIKPCVGSSGRRFFAELVNMEVYDLFEECIERWFGFEKHHSLSRTIEEFVECLFKGDPDGVSRLLNEELLNYPSFHDYKEENSYHMFIFGILLAASSQRFKYKQYYNVYSNREAGKGRSDCLIKPVDKNNYAVIIEFKHMKKEGLDLNEIAEDGLKQIEEKAYMHTLKQEGYEKIYKFSIVFYKKNCVVDFS